MNSKQENVLEDTKDLITTLHRKSEELKNNEGLRSMWLAKNDRLQKAIKLLTPDEHKEVEGAFLEWMGQNFPDALRTQNPPVFGTETT